MHHPHTFRWDLSRRLQASFLNSPSGPPSSARASYAPPPTTSSHFHPHPCTLSLDRPYLQPLPCVTKSCCCHHTSLALSSTEAQLLQRMVHSLGFEAQVISVMRVRLCRCPAISAKTDRRGGVPDTLSSKSGQPCTSPALLQFDTIPRCKDTPHTPLGAN